MIDAPPTYKDESEKVERLFDRLTAKPVVAGILAELEQKLPRDLYYHSYEHTVDVIREAIFYGIVDNLPETDIELLVIAAAFHDAGFLSRRVDNEVIGASMAAAAMNRSGSYAPEEIQLVQQMIMDTKIRETSDGPKQIASTPLSKYLLDADLANLGRDDFFEMEERVRRELRFGEDVSGQKALELFVNHSWHSPAAARIRSDKKEQNEKVLRQRLADYRASHEHLRYFGVSLDRLGFLTQLPSKLTSTFDTRDMIRTVLRELKLRIDAEAATVFMCDEDTDEIRFWALSGGSSELDNKRMPRGRGIVGWVVEHGKPVHVADVSKDPRFFDQVDKKAKFQTRDVICVPLVVRGGKTIGAVQALNSLGPRGFLDEDLVFMEHVAHQLAMAIDSAETYLQLEKKTKQLQLLDDRKTEIFTILAHEFRTPLNVIQTSAEMLAEGDLKPETVATMSKTLRNGVQRLARLATEIKALAHVNRKDLEIAIHPIKCNDLVEAAVKQFDDVHKERKLELVCSVAPDLVVLGDQALLLIALCNLLSNAIRFTEDGGKIQVNVEEEPGLAVFSVCDSGIGIPEDHLPMIFEKFYEVRDVLHHSSGGLHFGSSGLGIGLATVKSILAAHGTKVEIQSAVKKGSTFSFRLKLAGNAARTEPTGAISI